jgi:hypothetical protein
MTKELPNELWFLVVPFLKYRDLFSVTILSKSIRECIYSSPVAEKILCYAHNLDKTESNQEQKQYYRERNNNKPYEYSLYRGKFYSNMFFQQDTLSENFSMTTNYSLAKYQAKENNIVWSEMNKKITESFTLWRTNTEAKHFLCCSITANNGQDLVINKLLEEQGTLSTYNQALPGVRQVLSTKFGNEDVLINMISTPFLFAKEIDGFNRVDGIIYVVNTIMYPRQSAQVYRHMHDIFGEFHYEPLNCWVILADEENITQRGTFAARFNYTHLKVPITSLSTGKQMSTFAEEIATSLKINALQTCSWYSRANCVLTNTSFLIDGFKAFAKQPKVVVEELDDGTGFFIQKSKPEPVKQETKGSICNIA